MYMGALMDFSHWLCSLILAIYVLQFTTRGGDMESLLQDVTEAVNVMDNVSVFSW